MSYGNRIATNAHSNSKTNITIVLRSMLKKIGVVETAADFLNLRAGKAKAADMLPFFEKAKREAPPAGDERQ